MCDRCRVTAADPACAEWVRVVLELRASRWSVASETSRTVDLCPTCGRVFANALRETLDELLRGDAAPKGVDRG